jgi:hypothetical protein
MICAELEVRPCAVNGCNARPPPVMRNLGGIYTSYDKFTQVLPYARFPMSRARGCFGIASGPFGMM